MNAYEYILKQIQNGVESFVVAVLSIYFYIISTGTLTQNDMTSDNLASVMTTLGYTYDTSTDTFNDGTTDYTIYQLLDKIRTDYYEDSEPLHNGTMLLMIMTLKNKGKITEEQATTLKGLL